MIELIDLVKRYRVGRGKPDVKALKGISLKLPDTGMVFILGKSGSGKSTFLNVVGGLDSFEGGDLILFGKSAKTFTDGDYNAYRNRYVGFIFQEYNIINTFSVRRNIELAVELQNETADKAGVDEILERIGLLEFADRLPSQLSGGQKQRIAIARALIKHPQVVLADEPTGALDSQTSTEIFDLLKEISNERLVICVSHDSAAAEKYADRIVRIKEGHLIADITRRSDSGVPVEGTTGINTLATGLIKIDDPQSLSAEDVTAIKKATEESSGPAYYAYGDHVRIPAELAEGDDSEDIPVGFSATTEDDIQERIRDNHQFRYTKSTMKSTTMFSLAKSTIRHSPGRLAMTVILSLLSFTILGVATSIASYDPAETFAESADIYRPAASVLTKTMSSSNTSDENQVPDIQNDHFTDEDIAIIQSEYPTAIPYVDSTRASLRRNMETEVGEGNFVSKLEGLAALALTEEQLYRNYGFTLKGELPERGEVVLTDYVVWTLSRSGYKYTETDENEQVMSGDEVTAESLIGKKIHLTELEDQGDADLFTISGIMTTDMTEDQLENDINLVTPGTTDIYQMEFENYNNGPLKLAYLNPEDMADPDVRSAILGATYCNTVLVPTPDRASLADLWRFSSRSYSSTEQDMLGLVSYRQNPELYDIKTYDIASCVVDNWLKSSTFVSGLSMVQSIGTWAAIVLGLIAVLVTMNYLFTSVAFKSRDIGILKGLGSASHEIFGIFVIEALIIATANFLVSILVSWGLVGLVNNLLQSLFGIPLTIVTLNWVTALVLLVISFVVSILSALIPSYKIANMKPVDAMKRNGA